MESFWLFFHCLYWFWLSWSSFSHSSPPSAVQFGGTWHLSTHHSASSCGMKMFIHLATLPVQTSLAGEDLCLGTQKWFWDFWGVEIVGTCSSSEFVYASIVYIITYFCANAWSCTQKYVSTICVFLLKVDINSGNANFSWECTNCNKSLQKIFSSTKDKDTREKSSSYDSLYVKRKGEIP